MTNDDKQKCAEIWEMFTSKKTQSSTWNEPAAGDK